MEESTNQKMTKKGRPKKKPDFTEKQLGVNPLTENFTLKCRDVLDTKVYVEIDKITSSEGVVMTGKSVKNQYCFTVEQEQFTKVFNKSAYRLHIMSLSPKARDLYLWLIYEIDCGKDYIWVNKERYMEELNVSVNTINSAIQDLIASIVIVPSAIKDVFWINPLFFFNGNRLEKYKDKIIKDE